VTDTIVLVDLKYLLEKMLAMASLTHDRP